MRISDWSSDVCSSDLGVEHEERPGGPQGAHLAVVPEPGRWVPGRCHAQRGGLGVEHDHAERDELLLALEARHLAVQLLQRLSRIAELPQERSEEHTSELQSLMRNSYAVFCLKKKNKQ